MLIMAVSQEPRVYSNLAVSVNRFLRHHVVTIRRYDA